MHQTFHWLFWKGIFFFFFFCPSTLLLLHHLLIFLVRLSLLLLLFFFFCSSPLFPITAGVSSQQKSSPFSLGTREGRHETKQCFSGLGWCWGGVVLVLGWCWSGAGAGGGGWGGGATGFSLRCFPCEGRAGMLPPALTPRPLYLSICTSSLGERRGMKTTWKSLMAFYSQLPVGTRIRI